MLKSFEIVPYKFINNRFVILDQTKLPNEEVFLEIKNAEDMWNAIHGLKVRGAPAIGVAAAYGLFVDVADKDTKDVDEFCTEVERVASYLNTSRPTAVNLSWALNRMTKELKAQSPVSVDEAKKILLAEAKAIHREDEDACKAMGEFGLELLEPGMGILTHCNAGTIATSKYGTCLAPIHMGQERGYGFKVYADETRPLLQGARLTSWELSKAGVDVTLICDNMASLVMNEGKIQAVVVGCDRMAANGDGANKIGTSGVAVLARNYHIPFYMFVPTSTIDLNTQTGDDIVIEEREGEEIYEMWYEKPMAPFGIKTYNPAFDVTKAEYITAVVTEKGIVKPPYRENLRKIKNL